MAWRRIRDDRGESIPLRRSYVFDKRPWADYWHHDTVQRRIVILLLVVFMPLVILTQRSLSNWKGWAHRDWLWLMLGWFVLSAGAFVGGRMLIAFQRRKDRRVSLCLACGTDLKGRSSESDGCTECHRCGAAWRLGLPDGQIKARGRLFRRSPIIDDRGVEHNASPELVPAGRFAPQDDPRVPMPREARRAYRRLWIGMYCSSAAIFAGVLMTRGIRSDWVLVAIVLAGMVPIAVGLVSFRVSFNRYVMPIMARRMVHDGRCPSCAAVLDGSPERDGCTLCGQCEAAWRVPRPGERTTRLCPTCEYELIDLEADATGRIKCPECGEAWYFTDA